MKINLSIGKQELVGYINVNILEDNAIGAAVEDGECMELRSINVLSYYSNNEVDTVINSWVAKLAHGGKIVISDVDLHEVGKLFTTRRVSLNEANKLLHGEQREPQQFKKCNFSIVEMVEYLKSKGLKILKQQFHGCNFLVVAERI